MCRIWTRTLGRKNLHALKHQSPPFPLQQFHVSPTEQLFPLSLSLYATQPANVGLSCLSYGPGHNVNISSNQFELLSLLSLLLLLCLLLFANVIVIMFEWSRRAQTTLTTLTTHTDTHTHAQQDKSCWALSTHLAKRHSKERLLFVFNVTLLLMFVLSLIVVAADVAIVVAGDDGVAVG